MQSAAILGPEGKPIGVKLYVRASVNNTITRSSISARVWLNQSVRSPCIRLFVTPLGADVFSILGVRNISDWLRNWLALYKVGVQLCDTRTPGSLEKYQFDECSPSNLAISDTRSSNI
jgi:hypothetical protein